MTPETMHTLLQGLRVETVEKDGGKSVVILFEGRYELWVEWTRNGLTTRVNTP